MAFVAPPHSYINTMDFDSPGDLAKQMEHTASDDALFASFFGGGITMKFEILLKIELKPIVLDSTIRMSLRKSIKICINGGWKIRVVKNTK